MRTSFEETRKMLVADKANGDEAVNTRTGLTAIQEFEQYVNEGSEAREISQSKTFVNGFTHQYDKSGNHRLVDATGKGGYWANYDSWAFPHDPAACFFIVTDYFDGEMPADTLMEYKAVGAVS